MFAFSGSRGDHGIDGAPGKPGERGHQGVTGADGVNGAPGPRGEEGPRGKQGVQGNGRSEVFVLHSYNRTTPRCPVTTHVLWEGFSLASSYPDRAISSSSSFCMRRFSLLQTLANLGQGSTNSVWHGAWDAEGAVSGKVLDEGAAKKVVARCSVCETERSLLTVHSGSTQLPQCPQGWESVWTGFSYITAGVSVKL